MNSLSWMIYLADTASTLKSLIFATTGIGLAGFCFSLIFFAIEVTRGPAIWWEKAKWVLPLAASLFVVATLLPSQQTIYMIAASEAGEYAIKTPEAQEIMKDLKAIIKGYASDVKK